MSFEIWVIPINPIWLYQVNFSICYSTSQDEAILPWSKSNWIDTCLSFLFIDDFPIIMRYLFPNLNPPIISTGSNQCFVLGMSPSYLPTRSLMSVGLTYFMINQRWNWTWINLIFIHSKNFHLSRATSSHKSSSIEIKLTVVNHCFVFCIKLQLCSLHFK